MRTSVERKRAALDGEGQGWLSRRTGATKKRRKAYDGYLYSFGGGFCLFVRYFFWNCNKKKRKIRWKTHRIWNLHTELVHEGCMRR